MKVTNALVKHLVDKLGLDKKHLDVSTQVESEVKAFAAEKIMSGELSAASIQELTATKAVSEGEVMVRELVTTAVKEATGDLAGAIELLTKRFSPPGGDGDGDGTPGQEGGVVGKEASDGQKLMDAAAEAGGRGSTRVKSMDEVYDTTTSALTYKQASSEHNRETFGDQQVQYDGKGLDRPTELGNAITGAWFKHMVCRAAKSQGVQARGFKMTDHEKELVRYAVDKSKFVGPVGHRREDSDEAIAFLEGDRVATKSQSSLITKTLLDDGTSGGLEAVPIEFDQNVIMAPLLEGELFPLVNFTATSRRRIEAFSMGTVTFGKTAEGTAITVFNTASFIAAFDTTISAIEGAMEIGIDFSDDSPTNIGGLVQQRYGEGFREKMDDLIAVGTGIGEITGLFTTAGLTNIPAATANLPYSTSDAEGLLFGVPKQYRARAGRRAVYVGSEVAYQRFRAIPHGTDDERRVMGMTHEDYEMLRRSFRVNESVPATKAGFFCMNNFRGYRRRGFSIRVETGGRELALKNQQLIIMRARMGGQLELAQAGAIIDDLPIT